MLSSTAEYMPAFANIHICADHMYAFTVKNMVITLLNILQANTLYTGIRSHDPLAPQAEMIQDHAVRNGNKFIASQFCSGSRWRHQDQRRPLGNHRSVSHPAHRRPKRLQACRHQCDPKFRTFFQIIFRAIFLGVSWKTIIKIFLRWNSHSPPPHF
jgi:hypothetical protein